MPYSIPTIEELLLPTFKQLIDFPTEDVNTFGAGKIFSLTREYRSQDDLDWYYDGDYRIDDFLKHPKVFQKLEWWQIYPDSIDVFIQVKYVQVLENYKPGYWVPGDIVPVTGYNTIEQGLGSIRFAKYALDHRTAKPQGILPATKEQYEQWLAGDKTPLPIIKN